MIETAVLGSHSEKMNDIFNKRSDYCVGYCAEKLRMIRETRRRDLGFPNNVLNDKSDLNKTLKKKNQQHGKRKRTADNAFLF